MSNNERIAEDTNLATGIGVGLSLGAIVGLTVFDDLTIGVGAGLVFGITIGMLTDSNKNKEE
ncbi:glycine zipper family protein [Virgibacillus ainsalahensis]